MNRRSNHRFGLALIFALGAALTLGSFWVLEVMRKAMDDGTPEVVRTEPDYFVEKFNFMRMSKTGQSQYNISGQRLVHLPADDTHAIELPVVNSLGKDRPPMTSHALRAVIDQDNSKVHMYQNVQIDRPASPESSAFHLTSDYLLVLPDDDVMQTDKHVEITLGSSKLTGVGMYANNATRQLTLSSNVHATFQPPARAGLP